MTKTDYAKQRKDPRWQKKRLQIMERDEFKCSECGDEGNTLNVHHAYYVSGRKPWQYPDWALATLCRDCHKDKHDDGEDHPDFADWTEEEKWREEPWETYLQWINDSIIDENLGEQSWDEMASLSRILKVAYQVSMDKGLHLPSLLEIAADRIKSEFA